MYNECKVNILLVDDRPENLLALEAVLENPQYKIIKANSGEEALKQLMKDDYAAILLDVQMPGLNGYETAKFIKLREKTMHIPIIFITAINKEEEHVAEGYSVGAMDYIFKPFDPDSLKSKVEGFVNLFKMKDQLLKQTELLQKKTVELEDANAQLLQKTLQLRKEEALSRIFGETAIDTMITFDSEGSILTINPAVYNMFGYRPKEVIGKRIEELITSLSVDRKIGELLEVTLERRDGKAFPAEMIIGKAAVESMEIYALTVRDITERKEQLEALQYQALHDELTGLPNRTFLYNIMVKILQFGTEKNKPFVFFIMDLDNFKSINDTLGHYIGDQLLKQVGERLRSEIGPGSFVVRLGGDEFALLLPNTLEEQAIQIAKQIITSLEKPFLLEGQSFAIGQSIGIALYPDHGHDIETIMRRADIAMYSAKRAGKNGYALFSDVLETSGLSSIQLMGDLKDAIDHDRLMLHYQPKVDMETASMVSAEALVRWNHPKHGVIPPDTFIPLAEETGLIKALTNWVMNEAMKQCRAWKNQGNNICVAVNLSARSLQDLELPNEVNNLLMKWGISPSNLILEITESFIMADPYRALEVLTRLHKLGISLSIDDFGTGYSSLSYIRKLPVQEIKIDKSFVTDLVNNKNDVIIVRSIINLAHNLGLKVVAEGVETEEILQMLTELGCNSAQGFYLCKPVPADKISTFFKQSLHFSR